MKINATDACYGIPAAAYSLLLGAPAARPGRARDDFCVLLARGRRTACACLQRMTRFSGSHLWLLGAARTRRRAAALCHDDP
jgi:hypothetical protein